jgi:hypothetical protein
MRGHLSSRWWLIIPGGIRAFASIAMLNYSRQTSAGFYSIRVHCGVGSLGDRAPLAAVPAPHLCAEDVELIEIAEKHFRAYGVATGPVTWFDRLASSTGFIAWRHRLASSPGVIDRRHRLA